MTLYTRLSSGMCLHCVCRRDGEGRTRVIPLILSPDKQAYFLNSTRFITAAFTWRTRGGKSTKKKSPLISLSRPLFLTYAIIRIISLFVLRCKNKNTHVYIELVHIVYIHGNAVCAVIKQQTLWKKKVEICLVHARRSFEFIFLILIAHDFTDIVVQFAPSVALNF